MAFPLKPRLAPVVVATLVGVAPLAACQQRQATAPAAPAEAPSKTGAEAPLAASEYFETLTETAFTAPPEQLDAAIAQARTAAERDRKTLPAPVVAELDQRLTQIADLRARMARADLALASVEAYRLLVSAQPAGPVPVEVSLLDYAGFRYDADLKAQPPRWDDAVQAADFAAKQWARISPRVTNADLRDRFSAALTEMAAAAKARDPGPASEVVTRELDMVDQLETYFSAL